MNRNDLNDAQTSLRLSTKLLERLHQAAVDENGSIRDIIRDAIERASTMLDIRPKTRSGTLSCSSICTPCWSF